MMDQELYQSIKIHRLMRSSFVQMQVAVERTTLGCTRSMSTMGATTKTACHRRVRINHLSIYLSVLDKEHDALQNCPLDVHLDCLHL